LDKSIATERNYPWEKISLLHHWLNECFRKLSREKRKINQLIIKYRDLFIPEDIQSFFKSGFSEGIFRFCSEQNSYLFSIPNEFYINSLLLHVPEYKINGKGSCVIELSEEQIRRDMKKFRIGNRGERAVLPEKYSSFLSCSFEEDPLPKESRDSIKSSFKSVNIDCRDAEDQKITFQTKGIYDSIRKSDFAAIEISSPTSNIMFEFGMIAALEKYVVPLINKEKEKPSEILNQLDIPITFYEYDLNAESLAHLAKQIWIGPLGQKN
jgi:hypothetical protein